MPFDCEALIIGAGPAGASTAILLAQAGWRVTIVEQHAYPRRKVCGECIAAGNLSLLDRLGVGAAFRGSAGPPLTMVGWMDEMPMVVADMPPCTRGPYAFGRALGRDRLDSELLRRASSVGVTVLQPVRVRTVRGDIGLFECTLDTERGELPRTIRAQVVVDAHGSWERGPRFSAENEPRRPRKDSDLFAFKANFRHSTLSPGLLPVLALPGGYGGIVVGDGGRTTLACCIRRDALASCRALAPGSPAGIAVERHLRRSCAGVGEVLQGADRIGPWLTVGPLRPGIRVDTRRGAFRVGNAAGESHPLIGEGISMALQSGALLADMLCAVPRTAINRASSGELHRAYAAAWRRAFAPRLRLAALYAHLTMRPSLAVPARSLLSRWPNLLAGAARLAGKAKGAAVSSLPVEVA